MNNNRQIKENENETITLQELQELEKKLTTEYQKLELEEKGLQTVIQCQVRRDEIKVRKEEIKKELYKITGEMLQENEECKREVRNEECGRKSNMKNF